MKRFVIACLLHAMLSAFANVHAQVPQVLGLWELDVAASSLPARLFPNGLACHSAGRLGNSARAGIQEGG